MAQSLVPQKIAMSQDTACAEPGLESWLSQIPAVPLCMSLSFLRLAFLHWKRGLKQPSSKGAQESNRVKGTKNTVGTAHSLSRSTSVLVSSVEMGTLMLC